MRISITQKSNQRNQPTEIPNRRFKEITAKERNFYFNLVKSAITETIVKNLFLLEGYNVHKYGMESSIPQMLGCLHSVTSETATHIKSMPDLIVQTSDLKEVYFIEVKYRSNGKFSMSDLKKYEDYPFKSTYFVILSKKSIKCITYSEMSRGFYIDEKNDKYHLIDREEFHFNENIYNEYIDLMERLFCNIE